MLRRKPTALTITAEDIAAFEATHAEHLARLKFLRTGDDPHGFFQNASASNSQNAHDSHSEHQMVEDGQSGTGVDPNDELKPLPGDKARIVRGREERIIGGTGAAVGGPGAARR